MLEKNDTRLVVCKNQQFSFYPEINPASLKNIELIQVFSETAAFHHTRDDQYELLFVIKGKGGIIIDGKSSLISAGHVVCVPANSMRSLANIESDPLQVISMLFYA